MVGAAEENKGAHAPSIAGSRGCGHIPHAAADMRLDMAGSAADLWATDSKIPAGEHDEMTGFDDREKSFEAKYRQDQEKLFRITSRRNRLLGLWAANLFAMPDNQALDYAKEVVLSDFEEPGDDDVVRKVLKDFAGHGIDMDEHRLRKEMDRLMDEAARQIEAEAGR